MQNQDSGAAGEEIFLENLPLIEKIIRIVSMKNSFDEEEQKDFGSQVHLRFIESKYAVFRQFQGRCRLQTYLTTAIENLARNFIVQKTGRWRPSAKASRLGQAAVLLERLIFREGHNFHDACQMIRHHHHLEFSDDRLSELAAQLPCRSIRQMISLDQPNSAEANLKAPAKGVGSIDGLDRQTAVKMEELIRNYSDSLDDIKRLILKMRFGSNMKVVDIAKALSLRPKQVYRRIDKMIARMRRLVDQQEIVFDRRLVSIEEMGKMIEISFFRDSEKG